MDQKNDLKMYIRKCREEDSLPMYQLLSDREVMTYIEPPFSYEQAEEFLKKAGLSKDPLIYAVDDEDRHFIGYVICHDYDEDSMEIGWILKKAVWGKGYAKQLTGKLIEAVTAKGKAVVIECSPKQKVTKHIAEEFGFSYAGEREGCDVYRLELPCERTGITIRKQEEEDIPAALDLAWKVFLKYEAPEYTEEGAEEFRKTIHDKDYLTRLDFFSAYAGDQIVGVIALRNEGKHIALFFVDGRYQGQGVGRKLFEAVKREGMTVNSSPYAAGIYRKLGFEQTDKEQTVNGLRFIPMKLKD